MALISIKALDYTLCEGLDTMMHFTKKKTSLKEIKMSLVLYLLNSHKILCSISFKNTFGEEKMKSSTKPLSLDVHVVRLNPKVMTLKIDKT
jgi:hypothetical protein